jgi:hypothetical protein
LYVLDRDVIEVSFQSSAYSGHINIAFAVEGNGTGVVGTVVQRLVADNPLLLAYLVVLDRCITLPSVYQAVSRDIHVV